MRIAVTGTSGQVVTSLLERGPLAGHAVIAVGRPALDLADPVTILPAPEAAQPDAIVSAAAWTAVDKAESEAEAAHAINAKGAGAVAEAAATLGVPLVHISTDYVFDGTLDRPWREDDPTGPTGVYGATKLAGEQAVLAAHGNSAILRTAWVYSPFGANFVRTMLRLAATRDTLGVVGDQVGNPTSALDIADGVLRVCANLAAGNDPAQRGLFHMTAAGEASWAEFARAIFAASADLSGPTAQVNAIATADYPTPATRPANSRLDCSRIAAAHGVVLPRWQDALPPVVARLLAAQN